MKVPRLAITCLLTGLVWTALGKSPFGQGLLTDWSLQVLFDARGAVTKPRIDPRIRIFAYDDRTVRATGGFDLSLPVWGDVLEAVARRKPRAIMIDKLFDNPAYDEAETKALAARIAGLDVPVVPISFWMPKAVAQRDPLVARPLPGVPKPAEAPRGTPAGHVYGAGPTLANAFPRIGHAMFEPSAFVPALVAGPDLVIPHWSLVVADDLKVDRDGIRAGDVTVPVDGRGRVLVDIQPHDSYAQRSYSMGPVVSRARKGKEIEIVAPGDYVVILPAMYTGNTDWRETPLGSMPGGFVMVAMLNSVLSGRWLTMADASGLLPLVAALAALSLAACSLPTLFVAGLLMVAGWLCLAGAAFIAGDTAVPWLGPTGALVTSLVTVARHRSRLAWMQKQRMQRELETAQLVQSSFFLPTESRLLDIAATHSPSSECGGDWWGHFAVASGEEYLIVADATGHGVSAALVTAMTFALVEGIREQINGSGRAWTPAEICAHLNHVFRRTARHAASMTCFVARFATDGRRLVFTNAGHAFPLVVPLPKEDGTVTPRRIGLGGDPIGMFEDSKYRDQHMELAPGDTLVFFSDGLVENAAGFSDKHFRKFLTTAVKGTPAELLGRISARYKQALAAAPEADDVTLVVVRSRAA